MCKTSSAFYVFNVFELRGVFYILKNILVHDSQQLLHVPFDKEANMLYHAKPDILCPRAPMWSTWVPNVDQMGAHGHKVFGSDIMLPNQATSRL